MQHLLTFIIFNGSVATRGVSECTVENSESQIFTGFFQTPRIFRAHQENGPKDSPGKFLPGDISTGRQDFASSTESLHPQCLNPRGFKHPSELSTQSSAIFDNIVHRITVSSQISRIAHAMVCPCVLAGLSAVRSAVQRGGHPWAVSAVVGRTGSANGRGGCGPRAPGPTRYGTSARME
jgi:hypothetical protein